jgi:hypothetical protein
MGLMIHSSDAMTGVSYLSTLYALQAGFGANSCCSYSWVLHDNPVTGTAVKLHLRPPEDRVLKPEAPMRLVDEVWLSALKSPLVLLPLTHHT